MSDKQKEIDCLKKCFRILEPWEIKFVDDNPFHNKSVVTKVHKAKIYSWDTKSGKEPEDYILHEILDIVIRAYDYIPQVLRADYREDIIVDLCRLLTNFSIEAFAQHIIDSE